MSVLIEFSQMKVERSYSAMLCSSILRGSFDDIIAWSGRGLTWRVLFGWRLSDDGGPGARQQQPCRCEVSKDAVLCFESVHQHSCVV
jgi:hypothetical protein